MAACGSLQHIFENPLPESPTLLETLSSWNQIKPSIQPIEQSSFTEIFGELHFKKNSESSSSPSSSSFPISPFSSAFKLSREDADDDDDGSHEKGEKDKCSSTPKISSISNDCHKRKSVSFSLKPSESLQLCTEGLGFESSDDVEDIKNEMKEEWQSIHNPTKKHTRSESCPCEIRMRSRAAASNNNNVLFGEAFPPPISCIGKSGKPWVCFKSYRQDGRFVLKQVRIPTQEFLHACREDGRLKLHFVQPNDETLEELEEFEDEVEDLEEEEELINDEIHEGKQNIQA